MSQKKTNTEDSETKRHGAEEDYGLYFYPERTGSKEKKSFFARVLEGRAEGNELKCLANVMLCAQRGETEGCKACIIFCIPRHRCKFSRTRCKKNPTFNNRSRLSHLSPRSRSPRSMAASRTVNLEWVRRGREGRGLTNWLNIDILYPGYCIGQHTPWQK